MSDSYLDFYFTNTKSGTKEKFNPKNRDDVKIYSCGPTVYNFAHIGNIRSFLFVDILRRSLLLGGYKLNQSMNITDIDDKIINESIKKGISIQDFTKPWTEAFFKDLETLQVLKLEHYPKATESIEAMVDLVNRLDKNGLVYEKDGSYYFSISNFKQYGSLSKIDVSGMKSGVRYDADEYEKDDVRDFVLWKNKKDENETCFSTHLGEGRPGWHLECSAMIRKIYGSGIDIHTGGIDLLFPHHENEMAQSLGAYPNEEFVGTWLHCEHLLVDGEKMSKSKGNFYTLRDLLDQGIKADVVRYHLISAHYRSKLNFSISKLNDSKQALERIQNTLNRLLDFSIHESVKDQKLEVPQSYPIPFSQSDLKDLYLEFLKSLSEDLNMPKALASIFDGIRFINQKLDTGETEPKFIFESFLLFQVWNQILGVLRFEKETQILDADLERWIEERIDARKVAKLSKNYTEADSIRKELEVKGIILTDTKEGKTTWKKVQ